MGKKEFDEKGETEGLMFHVSNPLWGMVKVVVMDSGFCVMEGIILMVKKGSFGLALIKKSRYW